eukprot:2652872-Alexandrium_andersonii.AAC.1
MGNLLKSVFGLCPEGLLNQLPLQAALYEAMKRGQQHTFGKDLSTFSAEVAGCVRCMLKHCRRVKRCPV